MKPAILIGLIGDHNAEVTAHTAIPKALQIAAGNVGVALTVEWLPTPDVHEKLSNGGHTAYDGLWCVPASPYKDTSGAICALGIARTKNIPTLGTCGGFQHMAIEFAQHVLHYNNADNAEINPDAENATHCAVVLLTG